MPLALPDQPEASVLPEPPVKTEPPESTEHLVPMVMMEHPGPPELQEMMVLPEHQAL